MLLMSGVILMGGKSRRMKGTHKAFLPFNHEITFLSKLVKELSFLPSLFLSVDKKEKYKDLPYSLIEDTYPETGPLGGIVTALETLPTPYVFVVACDMPFITQDFIKYAHSLITLETECIVFKNSKQQIYPLGAIYSKKIVPLLKAQLLQGNYKIKDVFPKIQTTFVSLETTPFSDKIFENINTQEEYQSIFQIEPAHSP